MADLYANFLELWGLAYLGDLSKYMYKADLYSIVFFVMLLLPLVVWVFYYKVIDNIKLARVSTWMIILAVVFVLTGLFSYIFSYTEVIDYLHQHNITRYSISYGDIFTLSLIASLWSVVFSIIFSWVFKNLSIKCRNIPF